ncbi:MAG: ParA family protein [Caldiserica bacterium]|nr:ParA family protein [Caldisericota bacterium]
MITAIINQKGGTGKTSTSVNLAAALGEQDKKCLVIDIDPQKSATRWLGIDSDRELYDAMIGETPLEEIIIDTGFRNLHLIPGSEFLVGIERALAGEMAPDKILKRKTKDLKTKYDYILIDCPPSLGMMSLNALTTSDNLIIPVEAHYLALAGVAQLENTIVRAIENLNESLSIFGVLACRVTRTKLSGEVIKALEEHFGEMVFKTAIRENIKIAESPSHHKPVTVYDPTSIGAHDYASLAQEVIERSAK